MSSFAGRMKEYPTISLDRFDRDNLFSRAYFLSHCHKDHMKGLKGPLLKRKLHFSRTVRLYCSFVTKELLLSNPKYQFWTEFIVPLELDSPTQISLVDETSGEKEEVVVTLLPAGHCPGSVMFLFEGSQGTVLYTGDFRFAAGDVSRMEHLHSGSRVKDIQSIYLDSTFYEPRFYQIPTREACLKGISELIGNWISQSSYHVVWLNCKAAYGYEYLFTNLGETFNTQIHINNLAMFKKMPEILSYVTTDRRTQIHACRHPKDELFLQGNRLPCGCTASDGTPLQIISIKPSTMWFGERTKKTNVIIKTGAFSYRACFSFHSSYCELKDFLTYLQPVNIYPSVIPVNLTLTEITHMLKLMCRSQSDQTALVYKPLGVLKRSRVERPTYDSASDDDLFDGPDLAPVRKKMGPKQPAEHEKLQSHQRAAPPVSVEESLPLSVANTQSAARNYIDCTESNGEDEEDEEEEEVEEHEGDIKVVKQQEETRPPVEEGNKMEGENKETPKWEDFFTAEMPSDSQNSQSQSCCSKETSSQTPELFSEEEEETPGNMDHEAFSLTLSLSNHSSQNLDSCFPDTLILQPEPGDTRTNEGSQNQEDDGLILQSEPEELSQSQASSDFDIPCTPESKPPRPDELSQLYRTLASGEEGIVRNGSKGFA